ncbi:hypothetical protein V5O48_014625 [Marasmius crinis-equi]|uniref:Uncharacterized protein n=1 Tax=Marasmius crinis-equi TaxID=585013 RepID=A0ABR3EWS8_9AGAR
MRMLQPKAWASQLTGHARTRTVGLRTPRRSRRYFRVLAFSVILATTIVSLQLFRASRQWNEQEKQRLRLEIGSHSFTTVNFTIPTGLPPLYERFHEYERNLPQHDLSLPAPEGKHARFLNIASHVTGFGWGNALQEMIMNAHLAYHTERAWVFDNYTWDRGESEYSQFGDNIIPSRIPLSAILSGPIVGGPWKDGLEKSIPRAVTPHHFREACSEEDTAILRSAGLKSIFSGFQDGATLFKAYADAINSIDARCIEIRGEKQIFDGWLFGTQDVHSLWPEMSKSPILRHFGFSPLVLSAYLHNEHHFGRPSIFLPLISSLLPSAGPLSLSTAIPGLIVLHIRRGDYEEHCRHHLARYHSTYLGYNSFPDFPDQFEGPGEVEDEQLRYENVYQKHCYPSIGQIVERVNEIREQYDMRAGSLLRMFTRAGRLKRLYIMSNGKEKWLKELKLALARSSIEEWEEIATSRDLELTLEQKYVAQAVDMYIASKAAVFVGNGCPDAQLAMAISSDTIIIIAVCASVGVLVLAISSRFILVKLAARKSAPLPPKQPLAHHRATYYQTQSTPFGYYHSNNGGGDSKASLGSKERFIPSREASSVGYYSEEVQSIPSLAQTPLQQPLHLETPTPSFHRAQATGSETSLSAHSSSEGSNHHIQTPSGEADVPFPPSESASIPASSTQSTTLTTSTMNSRNTRPRPLSHASVTSATRTARTTTKSFGNHAQRRRSGVPHDPSTGVQIILPAPLSPTYAGASGTASMPSTLRGSRSVANMPEKRLSFVDAWAPNAARDREGSGSSSKVQRPRSSLHISHSPTPSEPPSPALPAADHSGTGSRQTDSPKPSQKRPATAPHRYFTPSPHNSRANTPLPEDLERGEREDGAS